MLGHRLRPSPSMSEPIAPTIESVLQEQRSFDPPAELAAQARITGRVVQLPALDALAVEHILARLREVGVTPEDIEIRKADLEDVFLDLTGAQPRSVTPVEVPA